MIRQRAGVDHRDANRGRPGRPVPRGRKVCTTDGFEVVPLRRVAGIVGGEGNLVEVVGLCPFDVRILLERVGHRLERDARHAREQADDIGVAGHHAYVCDRRAGKRRDAVEFALRERQVTGRRGDRVGIAVLDDDPVQQRLGLPGLRLGAHARLGRGARRAVRVEDLVVEPQPVDGFLRLEERQRGLEREAIGPIARPSDLGDARAQCLDDEEPMSFRQGGDSGERFIAAELDDDRVDVRCNRRRCDQRRDDEQQRGERAARP